MKNIIKKISLIVAIGLISLHVFGQRNKDVPQAVVNTFSSKYPQAYVKKWKSTNDAYMVYFNNNNKKYIASWSKTGEWIKTERDISNQSDLPAELQSYLKTGQYASWHIDDMMRVRTPQQNMYVIKVDNHSGSPFDYEDTGSAENRMLSFNDSGKLLKVTSL